MFLVSFWLDNTFSVSMYFLCVAKPGYLQEVISQWVNIFYTSAALILLIFLVTRVKMRAIENDKAGFSVMFERAVWACVGHCWLSLCWCVGVGGVSLTAGVTS